MIFSIAIPAYKSKFLKEAIDSILDQSFQDFELVIVDDCSPENLEKIVKSYNDPRIRYFRNKENFGAINVVDNWNKCLEYCKGDYIICMGDDDCLLPCCLEEYHKLMCKYPNLGIYHAWAELIDEKGNFYEIQQPRVEFESALSLAWNRWNGRSYQFIGDFCFNIKILRHNGGFFKTTLAWGADDISAIIAANSCGIANTQCVCFQYRVNRYTITNSGNHMLKLQALIQEKEWYSQYLKSEIINVDSIDLKYKHSMINMLDKRFKDLISYEILQDIKNNKNKIFFYFKHLKQFNLSIAQLFKIIIKSFAI